MASLLDVSGRWDMDTLNSLFPPNEVRRIQKLTPGRGTDHNIWAYTDHGSYTVKSGYWLTANRGHREGDSRSPADQTAFDIKKSIWKTPTLPKIRLFMWRDVSGALAVAERLNTRGMNVDPMCKLCNNASESINHVLFQCHPAQDMLQTIAFPTEPAIPRSLLEFI
ncbi:hypothetical protein Bca4012_037014 [Brassica carinata]